MDRAASAGIGLNRLPRQAERGSNGPGLAHYYGRVGEERTSFIWMRVGDCYTHLALGVLCIGEYNLMFCMACTACQEGIEGFTCYGWCPWVIIISNAKLVR